MKGLGTRELSRVAAACVAVAFAASLVAGCGGTASAPAGTCPARPELVAAAPACNTLTNAATAIPFSPATGAAPAPAGGTIQDGLYEATRTEAYGATTGSGRRITFLVTGGATHMLWAGEVLDANGATVELSFRADATIAVAGTRINFTVDCSTMPSPIPAALDFTASGQTLVMSLASGSTVAATTYTRRGCAP
jgi:hypothetical protein